MRRLTRQQIFAPSRNQPNPPPGDNPPTSAWLTAPSAAMVARCTRPAAAAGSARFPVCCTQIMFATESRCVVAGVRCLRRKLAVELTLVWRLRCGDFRTMRDVGILSRQAMWEFPHVNLGVVMARRTVEVRKPRDIGDAIRAVREARGISQEDLAQENAYDRFYLYRLEAGRSTVYITRLLRTLKSLGITLSVTFDAGDPAAGDGRSDG